MTTAVCRSLPASSSYNLIAQSRKNKLGFGSGPTQTWSYSNRIWLVNEPRHEKTGFLHMRKQRCRSYADQLHGNLCAFVFATWIVKASTSKVRNFKPLAIFCGYTARFVSDLVGNPEDRFSHNEAQITQERQYQKLNEKEQQNKPQKSYHLGNDGNKLLGGLLAHLSRRLIGELVGHSWSGVRPSSSVGVVHNAQTSFSLKLLGQSKRDCM